MTWFERKVHSDLITGGIILALLAMIVNLTINEAVSPGNQWLGASSLMCGALVGIALGILCWWNDFNLEGWGNDAALAVAVFGLITGGITSSVESLTSGSTFYIWGSYAAFVLSLSITLVYGAMIVQSLTIYRQRRYR